MDIGAGVLIDADEVLQGGRLSSMPLRIRNQVKLVSQAQRATAIFRRSNFGLAGACAQAATARLNAKQITPTQRPCGPSSRKATTPSSVCECTKLLREFDIFKVRKKARNDAGENILPTYLGFTAASA